MHLPNYNAPVVDSRCMRVPRDDDGSRRVLSDLGGDRKQRHGTGCLARATRFQPGICESRKVAVGAGILRKRAGQNCEQGNLAMRPTPCYVTARPAETWSEASEQPNVLVSSILMTFHSDRDRLSCSELRHKRSRGRSRGRHTGPGLPTCQSVSRSLLSARHPGVHVNDTPVYDRTSLIRPSLMPDRARSRRYFGISSEGQSRTSHGHAGHLGTVAPDISDTKVATARHREHRGPEEDPATGQGSKLRLTRAGRRQEGRPQRS